MVVRALAPLAVVAVLLGWTRVADSSLKFWPPLILGTAVLVGWRWMLSRQEVAPWGRRWFQLLLPIGGLLAALACAAANAWLLRGQYAALHRMLVAFGLVIAPASLRNLVGLCTRARATILAFSSASLVTAILTILVGALKPLPLELLPYVASRTVFGPGMSVPGANAPAYVPSDLVERTCRVPSAASRPPTSSQEFLLRAGLPGLPPEALLRRNLLLVSIEALRFDESSMGGGTATPSLRELQLRGAFSFRNAWSPSANTLTSMSSVLGMRPPSMLPLTIRAKDWCGELLPEADTAAEILRDAGWATMRIVHGSEERNSCISGLNQGFIRQHVEPATPDDLPVLASMDERIVSRTISELDLSARSPQPFFAWVFLFSPHQPYVARRPGKWTPREAYRQGVEFADAQLGRLINHLAASDLLSRTVVVVLADHGEEFGDHGGQAHNGSVYAELTHVPLLVWIPDLAGGAVDRPVSTAWVLPWLMLSSSESVRRRTEQSLALGFAPALVASRGMPVVERLGWDVMQVGLVSNGWKLNRTLNSGLTEIFRIKDDPLEQVDLYPLRPPVADDLASSLEKYLEVRSCLRGYRFDSTTR